MVLHHSTLPKCHCHSGTNIGHIHATDVFKVKRSKIKVMYYCHHSLTDGQINFKLSENYIHVGKGTRTYVITGKNIGIAITHMEILGLHCANFDIDRSIYVDF